MTKSILKIKEIILIFSFFTHDKEQLGDGQQLSLEQFIDGALSQTTHLPPVREQREAGEKEADDVDQEEENDEEIKI